ncbi:MAG: SGNH/GDSL hydrolase family protein [Cyclobacteriaceae bacterium]
MKITYILGLLLTIQIYFAQGQSMYQIPETANKIVFLGNSITYSGGYVNFIEAILRLELPERKWEFINVGLPSETVSGLSEPGHADGRFPRPELHERLERVLNATQPDLVFSCYGMNDGIYLPFDAERFKNYQEGQIRLHQKVVQSGAEIIHLTPPIYDERKGKAYANVLDIYASWLISQRFSQNWKVIDLHWPMKIFQYNKRSEEADFALAEDGIHPGDMGHWLMARELLVGLGFEQLSKINNPELVFKEGSKRKAVLDLVKEKQMILKNAWLSHTGHQRPGLEAGLPLQEALDNATTIDSAIVELLK